MDSEDADRIFSYFYFKESVCDGKFQNNSYGMRA